MFFLHKHVPKFSFRCSFSRLMLLLTSQRKLQRGHLLEVREAFGHHLKATCKECDNNEHDLNPPSHHHHLRHALARMSNDPLSAQEFQRPF